MKWQKDLKYVLSLDLVEGKPRLDTCIGPTWYDDGIPEDMVPQTDVGQAKYSPEHCYVKVGKGNMSDYHRLCMKYRTSLNFIKCIPTALNVSD